MGVSNKQVIVFVFFGQQYWDQFKTCIKSIGEKWSIKIITDVKCCNENGVEYIYVPTPATVYDMLTFRKRIPEFVAVEKYDQIWYSDPDILFKGNILEKYKDATDVMVSYEPHCNIYHPCMNGWFTTEELSDIDYRKQPCINGGFFMVPKSQKDFWIKYRTICEFMESREPNKSNDQFVLNNIYHRKLHKIKLFDTSDVCFRPDETGVYGMVNHYIGMGSDKLDVMRNELVKIQGK
jgi:hypothetical protein